MYTLQIDGQQPIEYRYIDAAIAAGGEKFLIWRGNMFCCVKHPDLGLIYSDDYKRWYEDQQRAYDRVAG